jgi:hypothetical protein
MRVAAAVAGLRHAQAMTGRRGKSKKTIRHNLKVTVGESGGGSASANIKTSLELGVLAKWPDVSSSERFRIRNSLPVLDGVPSVQFEGWRDVRAS